MTRNGFTLVEMMVALLIFGLLAAAGVGLLSMSVKMQDASGKRLSEVAALRHASALLNGDLAGAVARPTRDAAGTIHTAFAGGAGQSEGLQLVRRGWDNLDGSARSSLQKVEYRVVEGRLERRAYRYLDGAEPAAPIIVLQGVEQFQLRYRDERGGWRDRWDPSQPTDMPRAVEIVLGTKRDGVVRELFLVGSPV